MTKTTFICLLETFYWQKQHLFVYLKPFIDKNNIYLFTWNLLLTKTTFICLLETFYWQKQHLFVYLKTFIDKNNIYLFTWNLFVYLSSSVTFALFPFICLCIAIHVFNVTTPCICFITVSFIALLLSYNHGIKDK